MITEWIVTVAAGFFAWIADLFPDWDVPEVLTNPDGMINQLFSFGIGLEPFVNWGLIGVLAAIPLTVWVIGVTVKAVRVLLGHIPGFGGNG